MGRRRRERKEKESKWWVAFGWQEGGSGVLRRSLSSPELLSDALQETKRTNCLYVPGSVVDGPSPCAFLFLPLSFFLFLLLPLTFLALRNRAMQSQKKVTQRYRRCWR